MLFWNKLAGRIGLAGGPSPAVGCSLGTSILEPFQDNGFASINHAVNS